MCIRWIVKALEQTRPFRLAEGSHSRPYNVRLRFKRAPRPRTRICERRFVLMEILEQIDDFFLSLNLFLFLSFPSILVVGCWRHCRVEFRLAPPRQASLNYSVGVSRGTRKNEKKKNRINTGSNHAFNQRFLCRREKCPAHAGSVIPLPPPLSPSPTLCLFRVTLPFHSPPSLAQSATFLILPFLPLSLCRIRSLIIICIYISICIYIIFIVHWEKIT